MVILYIDMGYLVTLVFRVGPQRAKCRLKTTAFWRP